MRYQELGLPDGRQERGEIKACAGVAADAFPAPQVVILRHNSAAMKTRIVGLVLLFTLALTPAFAVPDWGRTLMNQVSLLIAQLNGLQKDLDTNVAVMKALISQNTDTVNKMTLEMNNIRQAQTTAGLNTNQQQSQLQQQIQALSDQLAALRSRLNQMNDTLKTMQQAQQTLPAPATPAGALPPGPGIGAASGPGGMSPSSVLPPGTLFQNALSDYVSGNNALARGEFEQFLSSYPTDYHAAKAAYYLGDIYNRQQQYHKAISQFNAVIDHYGDHQLTPGAELKKALALSKLGQCTASRRELQSLIRNYPHSEEASLGRRELRVIRCE